MRFRRRSVCGVCSPPRNGAGARATTNCAASCGSSEFRRLGIELACLAGGQDWQATLDEAERAELAAPLEEFAARVLDRRLKRLVQADGDIAELEPAALHAIRLRAKRLRYAAEIFAPLYPGKATQPLHPAAEPAAGSARAR